MTPTLPNPGNTCKAHLLRKVGFVASGARVYPICCPVFDKPGKMTSIDS
jgi:hypothetical protein